MSNRLNLLVYLNAYRDSAPTNNPNMSQTKWERQIQGVTVKKPQSIEFCLAPGETRTLFNGTRTLTADVTTEYDLYLKSGSTYVLEGVAGTAPGFRTSRAIMSDATTEVSVAVNNGLVTIQSIAGTNFDFTPVVIGDEVLLGPAFNAANQGRFKVLSKTANSLTFENPSAINEASVLLGATFSDEVRVYSAAGVQKGDKVKIGSGFAPSVQNTYEVTAVQDNLIEFFFSGTLPNQESILNPEVVVYSSAKRLVYLETDKSLSNEVNGVVESVIQPMAENNTVIPGLLLKNSIVWSLEITNTTTDMATIYFVSVE